MSIATDFKYAIKDSGCTSVHEWLMDSCEEWYQFEDKLKCSCEYLDFDCDRYAIQYIFIDGSHFIDYLGN